MGRGDDDAAFLRNVLQSGNLQIVPKQAAHMVEDFARGEGADRIREAHRFRVTQQRVKNAAVQGPQRRGAKMRTALLDQRIDDVLVCGRFRLNGGVGWRRRIHMREREKRVALYVG